jgi:hypothetical protein
MKLANSLQYHFDIDRRPVAFCTRLLAYLATATNLATKTRRSFRPFGIVWPKTRSSLSTRSRHHSYSWTSDFHLYSDRSQPRSLIYRVSRIRTQHSQCLRGTPHAWLHCQPCGKSRICKLLDTCALLESKQPLCPAYQVFLQHDASIPQVDCVPLYSACVGTYRYLHHQPHQSASEEI